MTRPEQQAGLEPQALWLCRMRSHGTGMPRSLHARSRFAISADEVRTVTAVRPLGGSRAKQDVADFVAEVVMEVMRSAGGYDPRRGAAISWLYGPAGNVAAAMRRRQARLIDAERRVAGRAQLEADDYLWVEERIDAAAALRHT